MMEQLSNFATDNYPHPLYRPPEMSPMGMSGLGTDPQTSAAGWICDNLVASSTIACATWATADVSLPRPTKEGWPRLVRRSTEVAAPKIVISEATKEKESQAKQWIDRSSSKKLSPSYSLVIEKLADEIRKLEERFQRVKELDDSLFLISNLQETNIKSLGKELDKGITSFISNGDVRNARIHTRIALLLFPGDDHFRKLHKILAPPKILTMTASKSKSISKTIQFLKKSGKEYLNKWIALSDGQLLRVSGSYAELANEFKGKDVIITKVV